MYKYKGREKEYMKEYHEKLKREHPEKLKAWRDKWNKSEAGRKSCNRYDATHRNQRRAYSKKYQVEARKKISAYRLNKLHTDPEYYFKQRVRQCIRDSVGRLHLKKSKKTEEIVGLSFDEFKRYLLKTWEQNYGYAWNGELYHIDHIIPLSTASTEEEIIALCYYTNLQMLKPKDNLRKSNKIIKEKDG